MEKFIVSARKYRPVTFDTVVGQPSITTTLKNAIRNNHLAQAFLFTGPRGVGKTTTARILAKTINCDKRSENIEACNECESCKSFNDGHSLNIYELDAASNNSVDDIRALVDQVRYAPQIGNYKVYIIDEVHMLSASAFNAFLKTLEEPPSYAIFILATTEKHKIIPTILSRCQIFDFNRISVEAIAQQLASIAEKENISAEEDALHVIAQKADGALRDALSLFDQMVSFSGNSLSYKHVIENLNILDYDYYFRICDELLAGDIPAVLLSYNEILGYGFDGHNFINGLSAHFRDLMVCKDESTLTLLDVSKNVREKYKVQSRNCSMPWLLAQLDIANRADVQYKSSKNQRLHIELSLMKMCTVETSGSAPELFKKKASTEATVKNLQTSSPAAKEFSQSAVEPSPAVEKKEAIANTAAAAAAAAAPTTTTETKLPVQANKPASSPGGRKSISISGQLGKDNVEQKEIKAAEILPDLKNEFSQEKLSETWRKFADSIGKSGRLTLNAALTKREPVLGENFKLEFTVDSAAVEKDLNEIRSELLSYLRKSLSNYQISLTILLGSGDTGNHIPYTPSEKFKKFAEENPLILDMKNKFDLEIEY